MNSAVQVLEREPSLTGTVVLAIDFQDKLPENQLLEQELDLALGEHPFGGR